MNNKYQIEDEMVYRPNSKKMWCCFDDSDQLIKELNKLYKNNQEMLTFLMDLHNSCGKDDLPFDFYERVAKLLENIDYMKLQKNKNS